ncbi:Uma2 family endonuclease [Okeania sp.]|uniref:Uma2 family endonuclease n=1 Tax=Okeania sp. TaxID=3100323 RepID=UPI002B4B1AED|nr:Uma2 family endonuclease [Okeania sp.]MEB3339298.1 Uma2 family endonuclease [Okeania sp.]
MFEETMILQMPSSLKMTEEQFFEFCQVNQDLRIETNKFGELLIMSPVGSETGNREFNLCVQLGLWSEEDGTGLAFSSSAGFTLSTGAKKSPDASWIKLERWMSLSQEEKERFAPICPDFVVELMSPSDSLKILQEKMEEYMAEPGVKLGWLIDRKERKVYIYRPGMPNECLENPETVSGEKVLPGFVLKMSKVW